MAAFQIPDAFSQQMKAYFGSETYAVFEKALDADTKTSIRLNPFKPCEAFSNLPSVAWNPEGRVLEKRPIFTLDPLFHAGAYYVQESSSMFLGHILESVCAPKDGIYLDLSAAPGGKATLLGSYLGDEGFLVANEVIKARANILKENIIKWGLGNTMVTQNDPEHFGELHGFFDLVLVDAPCSGEGMFRKDPEARDEWSLDHVQLCALRQERIMDQAAALVKAGGYLVYSTCTFNERENEEIVKYVVSEFAYEPVRIPLLPEWNIIESKVETDEGQFFGYRFFPHLVPGEGLFVTVLKRSEDAEVLEPRRVKDFKHPFLKSVSNAEAALIQSQVDLPENSIFYKLQESVFWLNSNFRQHFEFLSRYLNIKYFGVELGQFSKSQLIPSHEWAMSIFPEPGFPTLDLDIKQALQFLRREEFSLTGDLPEGWILITYANLPLGWIKNLGNRINNYYPKEWRIRMQGGEDA
ncbi:NOL1/NOP2/sun family protein [Mariniradius saccharolyticus AK6]|uniref:NOL1/NOP2/sun family protein n=1 Tax=Mariniradius saccharolyticus AK6 TaxID=1239962 RepID=M7XJF7_9BACT|nr:NOL1/NOP2/sun family protein [Mariniradius saccharolyticus]EMS34693.1 NOL1/NOP2/sun family protein [Mariniradius saccharolyticus AK6]